METEPGRSPVRLWAKGFIIGIFTGRDMNKIEELEHPFYRLFRDLIIAIFGGALGAIFGFSISNNGENFGSVILYVIILLLLNVTIILVLWILLHFKRKR